MPTIRIAVASTPLTATLDEAVPAAVAAVEEAGRLGAQIVCLPETCLPGHRLQPRDVPDVSRDEIERALDEVAAAAARAGVVAIVGSRAARHLPGARSSPSCFDADGTRLGEQAKTQIAPSEEPHYVAGSGRRTFTAGGATFGIAICHEAGRYPEIVRAAAQAGAQVVFVPNYVTTEHGGLPERWCDPASPYEEKAHMCRALENTIYVAPSNTAGPDQGAATCIIDPDGALVAQVPYGEVGVAVADIDLERADGLLARRWSPERNVPAEA